VRNGRFANRFWASVGAKFPDTGDSLPLMPMNRHTKFDAASFILDKEIRNRTRKQITDNNQKAHCYPVSTYLAIYTEHSKHNKSRKHRQSY